MQQEMTVEDLVSELRARMQADPEGFLVAARLWWPGYDQEQRKDLVSALGSARAAAAFDTIGQRYLVMERLAPQAANKIILTPRPNALPAASPAACALTTAARSRVKKPSPVPRGMQKDRTGKKTGALLRALRDGHSGSSVRRPV